MGVKGQTSTVRWLEVKEPFLSTVGTNEQNNPVHTQISCAGKRVTPVTDPAP